MDVLSNESHRVAERQPERGAKSVLNALQPVQCCATCEPLSKGLFYEKVPFLVVCACCFCLGFLMGRY